MTKTSKMGGRRYGIKPLSLVAVVLLIGLAIIIGGSLHQGKAKETQSDKQTVIIGVDDSFAPMGFKDDSGKLVGFDIDLAKAVEALTPYHFVFQTINWDLKETELLVKNIDLIWNGYTVTSQREEKVLFSQPYMTNAQVVLVKESSPIQSLADLAGKTVATQMGSSAFEDLRSSGLYLTFKNQDIISYPGYNEVFSDLETGRSDAIVLDQSLANYYLNQLKKPYRMLSQTLGEESYAVGARKDETELINAINKALTTLKANGSFDTIYQKWFGQ